MGSRRIIEVKPLAYSPAARPSSTRAAPAKKRIWSIIGGISSEAVTPIGFPVFSLSRATNSSAWASKASAIVRSAFCRSDGVELLQISKAASAATYARSTSVALETGAEAKTSPVDGLIRSLVRPSAASTLSPLTKLCRDRLPLT